MKTRKRLNLPRPDRGVIAEMAKEAGITAEGMRARYLRGDAATIAEVARRTKARRDAERKALRELARDFGGRS